jgi:hypothetical protein
MFERKPEGQRKIGRGLRYLENQENDLRELKAKRWKYMANDTEEWASVVNEAKVLRGP